MPLTLDSCRAKVDRAGEHFKTLGHEIASWINSDPYRTVGGGVNAQATRFSTILKVDREPDLTRWSLLAGDAVHNLRSALDHLVYAIGVFEANADPPPGERVLMFPIADCAKTFSETKWRIKTLSPGMVAEIEALQPYKRPHPDLPPLLAVLRDLDDRDKHRLLNVAVSQIIFGKSKITGLLPGQEHSFTLSTDALIDGAEVAALEFPTTPPKMRHQGQFAFGITMRHALGPSGIDRTVLTHLLGTLGDEVNFVIGRLSALCP